MAQIVMLLTNPFVGDARVYREARSLVQRGHEVTVYAWDRQGRHTRVAQQDGIAVERIQVASGYGEGARSLLAFARFGLAAARLALSRPLSLVHCHDLDTMPAGYAISRLARVPVIYDAHEPYSVSTRFGSAMRLPLMSLERWMVSRADHVVTVNHSMVQWLSSLGASNVTLVANYPDWTVSPTPERFERSPDGPIVLGWIGSIKPSNRLELVIEAAKRFNARNPDRPMSVLFVGPVLPGYQAAFQRHVEGLGALVRVEGQVPYQAVQDYYRHVDMVAIVDEDSPKNRLGTSMKLFEAMAMEVPVVVNDVGETASIVDRERCGIVISDYQVDTIVAAFEALRGSPHLRRALGRNGSRAVRARYNWQASERSLLQVYSQLLPGRAQHAAPASGLREWPSPPSR